jgi:hypothetical protein
LTLRFVCLSFSFFLTNSDVIVPSLYLFGFIPKCVWVYHWLFDLLALLSTKKWGFAILVLIISKLDLC